MAVLVTTGTTEEVQHVDHADRAREHGAGGEGEGGEEEEGSQVWLCKSFLWEVLLYHQQGSNHGDELSCSVELRLRMERQCTAITLQFSCGSVHPVDFTNW